MKTIVKMDLWSKLNSSRLERRPAEVEKSLLKICLNQQQINFYNAAQTSTDFNQARSVVRFDELLSNKMWNLNNRAGTWRQVDHSQMHGSLSSQVQNQAASYNNHLHQYQGDWRLETPQQVFRVEEEKISNQMTHPRYEEFVHKGERFRNHAEFLLCRRLYEKELRKIRLDPAVDNIDFFNDPAENFSPYNIFGNDEIFKFAAVSPKLGKFSQPKYLTALEYDDMRKEFSTNGWDVEPFNVKDIVEFPPLKMLTEQSKLLEVFSSPMQQKNMIQNPVAKPLLEEESAIVLKEYRNKTYNYCVFCINNKEPPEVYNDHILKDEQGKIVCPILRAYVCPLCDAKGENAHTLHHCPNRNVVNLEQVQKSSHQQSRGIIRKRFRNRHIRH